jgi:hypothetical protein
VEHNLRFCANTTSSSVVNLPDETAMQMITGPTVAAEGCSTRYRLRSRVSQVRGGKKDDLSVASEFSKQRPSFVVCTSSERSITVRICVWRRGR